MAWMTSPRPRSRRGSAAVVLTACLFCLPLTSCDDPLIDSDEILTKGEKLYSQFDEELIIRHFFQDRKNGFFVDVGAYDWKDSSTTYYLEEHLGWSGIAIDAFEQHRAGYLKHRPRTRFFSYIVTDHSRTKETLYVAGALSSVNEDHVPEFVADVRDLKVLDEKLGSDGFNEQHVAELRDTLKRASALEGFKPKGIEVETITLNELLDRNGVGEIDFMSMDIEGGEPKALAGFDIERFKPELICIEVGARLRDEISDYFEAHGYERIQAYLKYDAVNWYFRPKSAAASDD